MIRFSKYLWVYFLLSALVIIPGVYTLARFGLKPAIDFTGGTLLELKFASAVTSDQISALAHKSGLEVSSIQKSDQETYLLRMKTEAGNKGDIFQANLTAKFPKSAIIRNESVGPVLGKELLSKTTTAALVSIMAILLYVAYAFKNIKFGVSAVVALVHDLLVLLGVFAILGQFWHVEVDTLFVTAFLTTMSFSVHDTIVVFDRIREMIKRGDRVPFDQLCDRALTETVGRSLTNSLTIIFMLLALALLGGSSVRWFVVALLVGTTSGAYSSPFIATPVLILWDRWEKKRKKI